MSKHRTVKPAKSSALEHGLSIVEFLAKEQGSPRSLSEISLALELPHASALRLLRSLCDTGYVQRHLATKRYSLTNRLSGVGAYATADRSLVEAALLPLRRLRDETGETSQLLCLHDVDSVLLDQHVSTQPFKFMGELGARTPWYLSAPGKAMAAALDDDAVTELLKRTRFVKRTTKTMTSPKKAWAEIERIRHAGYAMDDEEHIEGLRCVGAAILDLRGRMIGAITIAGFKRNFEGEQLDRMIVSVQREQKAISLLIQN